MTKTVLITGASSGIGLSHAIYLTSKGYTLDPYQLTYLVINQVLRAHISIPDVASF